MDFQFECSFTDWMARIFYYIDLNGKDLNMEWIFNLSVLSLIWMARIWRAKTTCVNIYVHAYLVRINTHSVLDKILNNGKCLYCYFMYYCCTQENDTSGERRTLLLFPWKMWFKSWAHHILSWIVQLALPLNNNITCEANKFLFSQVQDKHWWQAS